MPTSISHNPNLVIEQILGKPDKQRKTYVLCGLTHNANYAVYNNSLVAITRAINERVFFVDYGSGFQRPYVPASGFYTTEMKEVYSYFRKNVQYATPLTAMQFAGTYVGRRRTNYERAANDLLIKSIRPKDANIKAFIKAEKYNFTAKPNPAPRIIQPRDPRYIVESGRYVKPIEKKIYRMLNTMFDATTIFKGLNAEDRGAALKSHWDSFLDPVAVGLDAKRFDQHVSRDALEWEHSIYKLFYPSDKHFAMLLSWQLRNRGVAQCNSGFVRYIVDGCRMSGDVNTALGNCLIMSSLVYQYARSLGIRIKLANDGDDCVVIMERKDLRSFSLDLERFFTSAGFSLTVETPVRIFEEIEFCQSHPVYDGEKYIMVRDPRFAISKDTVALKPLDNPKIFKMWMSAVGQGGMSLTGGIPVWQHFYRALHKASEGAKMLEDPSMMTGMKLQSIGMSRTFSTVCDEARLSFYLAFGISPEAQLALERYYDDITITSTGSSPRFVPLPLGEQQC